MNTLIHKPKPYPKDFYQFYPEIQKIEVESKERFYVNKGWMLVKLKKFQESYETQRLLEEFGNHNIEVKLIDPNEIDIFVNKENKQSILVNGKSLPLPKFVFPRTGSGTTYYIKVLSDTLKEWDVS